jgi:hypothetical protein
VMATLGVAAWVLCPGASHHEPMVMAHRTIHA